MEFIERIPLRPVHFLNQMPFNDFKMHCKNLKNDKERKEQYDMVKAYCKSMIKAKGEIKRLYTYSSNTPISQGGRLYCGNSIQGLKKVFRGLLMKHTTDIDMKNAHPTILRYICRLNNIECPNLEYYINNRNEVLKSHADIDEDDAKTLYLKALNDDKRKTSIRNPFFRKFDAEMKKLQKTITKLECYKEIVESVPAERTYNWNGSAINRIMCKYENDILQVVIKFFRGFNIDISAPMFDGVMPYGDLYNDTRLLEIITETVAKLFPRLDMVWAYKPHDDTIIIPDDFVEPTNADMEQAKVEKKQEEEEWAVIFAKLYPEFEKTHAKIINKAVFVKSHANEIIVMSKTQLTTAYEHIQCGFHTGTPVSFISRWTTFNDKIRRYDDMQIYPNPELCPPNVFNMWIPFKCELYDTPYVENIEGKDFILNHIRILCNNEGIVNDYFIKWIGQMIQYPEFKTICITLISKQGAGKGTLLKLLALMLGEKKVLETRDPARDVWGNFNGIMQNAFLVNLNELSKKDTIEAEGRIKGLITDPTLTINSKGVNQYNINSYHRFITTTNNPDPSKTSEDDRRNLIIRSSDEKIGDKEYFNKINEYLDDVNVIRTCYDYFKSIPNLDKFGLIPIPKTEYQNNLKELARTPVEQWLEHFTRENINEEQVEMLGKETFAEFDGWRRENNITYETTPLKLGVALSNLQINGGINKGRHTSKGESKYYNIPILKKYFNIGLMIEIDDDDDDDTDIN